ncbi:MAG TPA: MFS transporter [Geothrix sp.]|nr:MFS transporter [Geothrix sp.]
MLMSSLDTSIANAGLPALARAFGASFQAVQWIVLAYLLAITTLIVSVGRLADRLGRKRLLLGGVGLFTVASLACGLAPSLPILIVARAAQGLGAAFMMALTVAFVGETVPKDRTGSAMGLLGTMSAVGTTLGPSLGGLLTTAFGWRSMFLVNVPLGLLILTLSVRFLPAVPVASDARHPGFPGTSTAFLAWTLGAYALAMTLGHGQVGAVNALLLAAAGAGLAGFLAVERQARTPLVPQAMFREPGLGAGLAMSVLVSAVMMSTLVVGPFYLARAFGLDSARVGLALSVGPLVAALSGVPAGRLVDRFGGPRMTAAGLGGMLLGVTLVTLSPTRFGLSGYLLPIMVTTSNYALFQAANNTVVMTGIQPEQRGVTSGLLSLSRNLGLITGASLMGAIFALASGATNVATASASAVSVGMRSTFAAATLLLAAALVVSTRARSRANRLASLLNSQVRP